MVVYLLGQHAHFVLVLLVVSELDLDLERRKLDSIFQSHRVGALEDSFLRLLV